MITLALIGVGKWGTKILEEASHLPGLKIKYLCSPSIRQKKLSKDLILFEDYKLLKNKEIKGVIIATPASTHFEISSNFIQQGQNILVEKPFTTSSKDALSLKKMHYKKDSIVMIGHIYLYNPAFLKLIDLVQQNGIPKSVEIRLCDEIWKSKDYLWEWGPHAISILSRIIDEKPQSFDIIKSSIDNIEFEINYSKTTANVKLGWSFKKKERSVHISYEDRSLVFDDMKKDKVFTSANGEIRKFNYDKISPLQKELSSFKNSILYKKRVNDIDFGIYTTKILEKIQSNLMQIRAKGQYDYE